MDEENDWDLMAIVRSCNKGKMKMLPSSLPSSPNGEAKLFSLPMLPPPPPQTRPILYPMPMDFPYLSASSDSAFVSGGGLEEIVMPFISHHQQQPPSWQTNSSMRMPKPKAPSAAARGRKRKNQHQKKVVKKVPAECIHSNDNWAWRKYGQKPIKGSPFPRGYYRCSTAKSCPARKHIEKSCSDLGLFIITYTGDHNHAIPAHRNALAGTTRNKWYPMPDFGGSDKMLFKLGLSPTTPLMISPSTEEEDEEEGILQVEDMQIVGKDELVFLGSDESTDTGCKAGFDAAFFEDDEAFL